ncbi:MAG: hypothetical protein ABR968_05855 [Bacteroidales bacterium]
MNRITNLIILFSGLIILGLNGCVTFAPPPPMMTYGGPQTTVKGTSDAAIALGTGVALFQEGHAPGQGWFGRYKYGLGDKLDLGVDAIGFSHSELFTFTTKIAARYQLYQHFRLEGGLGAADDSKGKSLNSELGLTWGTLSKERVWNYYASLRIGYAKGFAGNAIFNGNTSSSDSIKPPNTTVALLNIGTQGIVNDNIKFIFEGGYGYIFPQGYKAGITIYVSCGILLNIGKKK